LWHLKTLADIQVSQFFIPKTEDNAKKIITDDTYRAHLSGRKPLAGSVAVAKAMGIASEKRFFHWFLEFPEVFAEGGFNCILGNPPFLGGKRISGQLGDNLNNFIKAYYAPAVGVVDLVAYFFRRTYQLINQGGFQALISTNTIGQGNTRSASL